MSSLKSPMRKPNSKRPCVKSTSTNSRTSEQNQFKKAFSHLWASLVRLLTAIVTASRPCGKVRMTKYLWASMTLILHKSATTQLTSQILTSVCLLISTSGFQAPLFRVAYPLSLAKSTVTWLEAATMTALKSAMNSGFCLNCASKLTCATLKTFPLPKPRLYRMLESPMVATWMDQLLSMRLQHSIQHLQMATTWSTSSTSQSRSEISTTLTQFSQPSTLTKLPIWVCSSGCRCSVYFCHSFWYASWDSSTSAISQLND